MLRTFAHAPSFDIPCHLFAIFLKHFIYGKISYHVLCGRVRSNINQGYQLTCCDGINPFGIDHEAYVVYQSPTNSIRIQKCAPSMSNSTYSTVALGEVDSDILVLN